MTRKMKDSGIEWIGEIPEEWKLVKVKDAFIRKNVKANQKNPVVLSLARSDIKIRDISNNEGQLASDYSNYNPVEVNDLLLNPMDLISGDNCNISKVVGVISPSYYNLRYKKGINPEFYNLYFKNLYWRNVFFAHGKGVSYENRWTLSYETLSQMKIPYPPSLEQDKIAEFLVDKLNKLENVKSAITKEIQTLEDYKKSVITETVTKGLDKNVEMKDSGIEWIGEIPKHWKIIKIKDAFTRKNSKANIENPIILSLARSGVKIRDISNNEGQLAADYTNYNPVDIDDLLLNPMDLISGDNCNISKVIGVISPAYINLRYMQGTNPRFYNLYFKNLYWNKVFFAHGKGVSFENRWTLNYETLSQMKIPYPSIQDQDRIADFLVNKIKILDETIAIKQKQLETLEEYKKSLIYEYVTGKKEVKDGEES